MHETVYQSPDALVVRDGNGDCPNRYIERRRRATNEPGGDRRLAVSDQR